MPDTSALDAAIHALLFQSPQKGLRLLLIQPKTIMRSHFLPAGAIAAWFAMNQFNRRQIPLSPVRCAGQSGALDAEVFRMLEQQPLVLVANDDEAMRDALQFALQLENFEVHVHRSGKDLLTDRDLLRACCLILKDRMPDVDGIAVMHYLRERHLFPPAILLTANATPGLRRQAESAGIRMVLEKPILDNALLESVLTIMCQPAPPGPRAVT